MAARCAIYSRVSTDAQERDGTSLDTQERACVQLAEANGWTVVSTIRDAASGFTLERPGMTEVRSLAARGLVDVVLSYALDRLSRKQTHVGILVEEMEDQNVSLDFVTEKFEDTATGQLLRSVKAFAAEFEREKIAERTMRGKAERARSGRLPQATGRGMFGYIYDPTCGKRRIVPQQAIIVRRLFEEFASGASILGLASALNEESVRTMHDKSWSPATIFDMLRNPGYAGHTTYRRLKATRTKDLLTGKKKRRLSIRPSDEWIEVPNATPAIIPEAIFDAVQKRLDDPERLRHGRRISVYGLAGRIKCKQCGSAMVGQTLQGQYRYYRCRRAFAGPKHDRCNSLYVRADKLEDHLLKGIRDIFSQPNVILGGLRLLNEEGKSSSDEDSIRQRLESVERQRTRLLRLYQLGEIDDAYLERETASLRAERDRLASLLPNEPAECFELPDEDHLADLCVNVTNWMAQRGPDELPLISQALQLSVRASKDCSEVRGVIPEYAPDCKHANVRDLVASASRS